MTAFSRGARHGLGVVSTGFEMNRECSGSEEGWGGILKLKIHF
jgi:hypothetical protein